MQSDAGFSEMRHLICGFSITIAITAVTELGIIEQLADQPKTAAELATAAGADADALDGTRLLIVEHVVPATHGSHFARFMDMNMLALAAGGRERTEAAFARLLAEAGLTLLRVVPTRIDIAVLECAPA